MIDPVKARCRSIYQHHRARARKFHKELDYQCSALTTLVIQALERLFCPYCHGVLKAERFQVDHDRPVSRCCDFSLANLRVCCEKCNQYKGSLSGDEFGQLMELIRTWHPAAGNDVLCRLRAGGKVKGGWR